LLKKLILKYLTIIPNWKHADLQQYIIVTSCVTSTLTDDSSEAKERTGNKEWSNIEKTINKEKLLCTQISILLRPGLVKNKKN
jgi:hypothetical protein